MITFYLCQPCYTGFDQGPEFISGDHKRKPCAIGDHMWPRSNDTHLPEKHIDKLWEFIHIRCSQKFSNPCNAVIIFIGLFFISLFIDDHCTEFQTGKRSAVFPDPPLDKKNRPPGIKKYKQTYNG